MKDNKKKPTKELNVKNLDYSMQNRKNTKIQITNANLMTDTVTKQGYVQDSCDDYSQNILGDFSFYDNLGYNNNFMGYAQLGWYKQKPVVQAILSTYALEMTRRWISFISDAKDDKTERIAQLETAFKKHKVKGVIYTCIENTILYGGCLLFIKTKDDELNLDKELLINEYGIGIGKLEYFKVQEPLYCQAGGNWNSFDSTREDFYNPQEYNLFGKNIHLSRFLKFIYIEAPYFLKPLYKFFGIPLIATLIRDIERLENMKNSQEDIIARYNLSVLHTDLNALLYGEGDCQNVLNRMDAFAKIRDNNGILAIANGIENFEQLNMTITGVVENVKQALQFLCMGAQLSPYKLGKASIEGFNSTGDTEERDHYDFIHSVQEKMLQDNLTKMMHIIMLDLWGVIDEEIKFEFNSLWDTNQLEESQIRLNETNRANINVQNSITTAQQERERLKDMPNSGYEHIEVENIDNDNELDPDNPDAGQFSVRE